MNAQDALSTLSAVVSDYERMKRMSKANVKLKKPQDTRSLFGFNVKSERLEQNMSVGKLSRISGVGDTTIRAIEKQGYNTTLEVAGRLAFALNVPVSELLKEDEE